MGDPLPGRLPHDLLYLVAQNLPPLDLLSFINAKLTCGPLATRTRESLAQIWGLVFRDGRWISEILELGHPRGKAAPCLLGPGLKGCPSNTSLVLLVNDWSGDSIYMRDLFFECLQDHEYDDVRDVVKLKECGISLYVRDALKSEEWLFIPKPWMFFNQGSNGPFTYVTYYHRPDLEELAPSSTGDVVGVRKVWSLELEFANGKPLQRVIISP
ncbi:hypothetical protein ACJZ2D_016573 [Fusarium nematophilum]